MEKIFKFPEVRQEEERGVATSIQKDQRPVGSRLRFPLDELYNCTSVDFSVCEMHFFFISKMGLQRLTSEHSFPNGLRLREYTCLINYEFVKLSQL